ATADPTAQILVFLDADVRLGPDAVASTVDLMRRTGLDFATPMPALRTRGRAERLVQPLLPWSVLTFLPVRSAERSARPSLVAAAGPFFAVRRDAYDRAGGHAAVRGEVVEDIALARALRRAGSPGGIVDGSGIATARMYDGWAAVRDGYAKSAWCAFGSPARGVAVMTGLLVAYVAPPAAALAGSRIGAIGYAAGVVSRAVAAHRTGGRLLPDVLAHPASVAAAAWITGRSIRAHRRGTLTWKGRPV
ncbi:MAG: glycosyltransferase family 2 protein, partial [Mycobacteriales bacterium]